MRDKISTMLAMQDKMNSRVHAQWREQGFAWYRAIWTECAELMDHYGWKWWKYQRPDQDQILLELVDIWHFGLSIMLARGDDAQQVETEWENSTSADQDIDFLQLLEAFTQTTLQTKGFDFAGFKKLMAAVDMGFDDLYRHYVGKNMLNLFRQEHGYQTGHYHKVWSGREDNEHLAEILSDMDVNQSDYAQRVYDALISRYPQSLKSRDS